jgi:hypothetical protein
MTVAVPPHLNNRAKPPEDEVGDLLRAFYRRELPDPWPMLTPPSSLQNRIMPLQPMARRFTMLRARLALAACVAFLVAGPLGLASFFIPTSTESAATTQPTADDAKAEKNMLPYQLPLNPNEPKIGGIKIRHGREK